MGDCTRVSYIVEVHIRKVAIALSTHTSLWWWKYRCFHGFQCRSCRTLFLLRCF
jgi:hypothetical protein